MSGFALRLLLITVPLGALWFVSWVWLSGYLVRRGAALMRSWGMLRHSARGPLIPTAAAAGVISAQVVAITAVFWLFRTPFLYFLLPFVTFGFMVLGFYDDFRAAREYDQSAIKGWRGHLTAFVGGNITSGVVKAVCGGLMAPLAVAVFSAVPAGAPAARGLAGCLRDGVLIALSANAANCLDVKPGRACKGLVLGWLFLLPLLGYRAVPRLVMASVTVAPILGFLPWDLSAKVMMGDSGANAWGALWGAAFVVAAPPDARFATAVFLLGATVVAETVTFSSIIDSCALLRRIDDWGCH